MAVVPVWRFDCFRTKNAGDDFVSYESMLGSDNGVATLDERMSKQLDDLVRAVAENDVIGRDVEFFGNGVA